MSKKIVVLITLLVVVGFGLIWYFFIDKGDNLENFIPDDYIGIFCGGEGETTYSTYVYLLNEDVDGKGFHYINVTNTTKEDKTTQQVTKKGNVELVEEVFYVAALNNAFDYSTLNGIEGEFETEVLSQILVEL